MIATGPVLYGQTAAFAARDEAPQEEAGVLKARISGLLLGSAIGDALGGPVEFQQPEVTSQVMSNCRDWKDERCIQDQDLQQFGSALRLSSLLRYGKAAVH